MGAYSVASDACILHYCLFVRGIHHSWMDSPHNGPLIWNFDGSLIKESSCWWCHDAHLMNHIEKFVYQFNLPWFGNWNEIRLLWYINYNDVTMDAMVSQIASLTIVYSIIYSSADQRKHQNSLSLAFVRGIHWCPVDSPHKVPVMQKMFPFDDVIMKSRQKAASWFSSDNWKKNAHLS